MDVMGDEEATPGVVPTNIPDFDAMLDGGIPAGHVVLLAGDSGTGKTILAMEWLFRGHAEDGDSGLYITLTEPVTEALENIQAMSFYDEGARGTSGVHMTDMRSTVKLLGKEGEQLEREDIDDIIDAIEQQVEETGATRLVLDSVTAIAYMFGEKDLIRTFIFRLGTMLEQHDVTTLLTSEVSGDSYSRYDVAEFISDGIIKLEQEEAYDGLRRNLTVYKMRGTDYDSDRQYFRITSDGIHLFTRETDLAYEPPAERVTSGIEGLNEMLDGGFLRGTTTLLRGPPGAGKTLTGLQFTAAGAANGDRCLFYGVEENEAELRALAESFGWELGDAVDIVTADPSDVFPEEHMDRILRRVETGDYDRLVLDSLSTLRSTYPDEKFQKYGRSLTATLKRNGTTGIVTSSQEKLPGEKTYWTTGISTLVDNVIDYTSFEADGKLRYSIAVLKTKNSDNDSTLRQYRITPNGFQIEVAMSGYEGVMTGDARKRSETAEEMIREEFVELLGPAGRDEFRQAREDGLTQENLLEYVDGLEEDGVVSAEDADGFREEIREIMAGERVDAGIGEDDGGGDTDGWFDRLMGGS